jgi:CubicO group peptidase (beta-lactamase class C family)
MNLESLGEFIEDRMAHYQIPGVALGLLEGQDQHHICSGITSVRNPLEVTTDTLFQIGSTTKTMTATAIMRLVQDGLLELNKLCAIC